MGRWLEKLHSEAQPSLIRPNEQQKLLKFADACPDVFELMLQPDNGERVTNEWLESCVGMKPCGIAAGEDDEDRDAWTVEDAAGRGVFTLVPLKGSEMAWDVLFDENNGFWPGRIVLRIQLRLLLAAMGVDWRTVE